MGETSSPRTRLEQILRQRHLTLEEFRRRYERASGSDLSERQAYRWVAGDLQRLPYPHAQAALERLLGDIADTQDRAFTLLEGRQKPNQTRDLYLLAGVVAGLMAKASHDLGAPHDAMTQARAAYTCADNAGHDGLRAWTRGLQSLIAYWSGRSLESVRYAEQGADAAARSRGTSAVWLVSGQARALAALGRNEDAHAAMDRATATRDQVHPDELDEMGGLCTFGRPRQLYYAADAMAWVDSEADHTERLAVEALDAYAVAPAQERAFGDEAGTRCALALARVRRGQLDGAAEALDQVLGLPSAQRIHGIVTAVGHVNSALRQIEQPGRVATDLLDAMQAFTSERLALPPAEPTR